MSERPENQTAVGTAPSHKTLDSSRYGYVPIPLRCVPCHAFNGIAVYLRRDDAVAGEEAFTLYRGAGYEFEEDDRERLLKSGLKYVYIQIADHLQFQRQAEACLGDILSDPNRNLAEKSELVYETSLQLVNEVLSETDLGPQTERLANVSRAVATLVLSDTRALMHLFTTSRHDFYTATHLVNVGTWMVSLAYATGERDPEVLQRVCQAGLLHDYGKVFVPSEILNKPGVLTEEEWQQVRRHPLTGAEHVALYDAIPSEVGDACRQHHERADGSGYPEGLAGDRICRLARMCAVVDSFDAMTAVRPFRKHALSVSEAMVILRKESPSKYDAEMVTAWLDLLKGVSDRDFNPEAPAQVAVPGKLERRRHKRFPCNHAARVHLLAKMSDGRLYETAPVEATVRNVSRSGLVFVSQMAVELRKCVHVYLATDGTKAKRMHGRVVRCDRHEGGQYYIGVELFPPGREPCRGGQ